jgi:hypothetical protein
MGLAVEHQGEDPALTADPEARACRALWLAVLGQALADARSASAHYLKPEDRAEARTWLSVPSPGRTAIMDAIGLAPDLFDRPQVQARLREGWAEADATLAVNIAQASGRKRVPVTAPDGTTFPAIRTAARALGLPQSLVRARALAGEGGWSVAA